MHIPHPYSNEMAKKSEVVPLGVLPKNENKYEDMIDILQHLQQYIPAKEVTRKMYIPGGDEPLNINDLDYATILLGGDQLTVERARGSQLIRSNSGTNKDSLSGLLPVVEDWHTKMCLMQVIWKRLYNTHSGMQRGTLYQLRHAINHRNVSESCKRDVNACEDFLQVVVTGHIATAAMSYLGMSSIDDTPSQTVIPEDAWTMNDEERALLLLGVAKQIVNKYVDLAIQYDYDQSTTDDTVYSYACETLSLGLLFLEFKDAIREGDGDRVLRVWKFLLLLFKASKRTNYALKAFTLLAHYHILLPPRLAEQLKWCRFINIHRLPGHNISCDLHMEHLNRLAKTAISGLGANKSAKAIIRVGKTIGALSETLDSLDKSLNLPTTSGSHTARSITKDFNAVVKILQEQEVFHVMQGRKHKSFNNLRTNLIRKIDEHQLKEWMTDHFASMVVKN